MFDQPLDLGYPLTGSSFAASPDVLDGRSDAAALPPSARLLQVLGLVNSETKEKLVSFLATVAVGLASIAAFAVLDLGAVPALLMSSSLHVFIEPSLALYISTYLF